MHRDNLPLTGSRHIKTVQKWTFPKPREALAFKTLLVRITNCCCTCTRLLLTSGQFKCHSKFWNVCVNVSSIIVWIAYQLILRPIHKCGSQSYSLVRFVKFLLLLLRWSGDGTIQKVPVFPVPETAQFQAAQGKLIVIPESLVWLQHNHTTAPINAHLLNEGSTECLEIDRKWMRLFCFLSFFMYWQIGLSSCDVRLLNICLYPKNRIKVDNIVR